MCLSDGISLNMLRWFLSYLGNVWMYGDIITDGLTVGVIPKVPWLTRTTLRPFRLFMLSSASAVVLPYPHSRWKVIHLLCLSFIFYLLGPEIYSYDLFELKHFVVIITLHRQTLHYVFIHISDISPIFHIQMARKWRS